MALPPPEALSAVLDLLACPACHAALLPGPGTIDCAGCGRRYPVIDGIPVLIIAAP